MKNKRTFRNTFSLNKDIEKNLSRTKICMINPRSVLLDWKLLLRFDTPKVPLGKDHTLVGLEVGISVGNWRQNMPLISNWKARIFSLSSCRHHFRYFLFCSTEIITQELLYWVKLLWEQFKFSWKQFTVHNPRKTTKVWQIILAS